MALPTTVEALLDVTEAAEDAYREKMNYNHARADHKPEHRLREGGKRW